MTDLHETIDKAVEKLKQERDELRLQAHLAKAELKDEWETIERKFETLYAHRDELASAASDAAHRIGESANQVMNEIKQGFERLRKHQ